MKYLSVIAATVFVAACAQTYAEKNLTLPSGEAFVSVKCSQTATACFRQAATECQGQPYQVMDSESHAGGLIADIIPGPVTWYSMQVACGRSDGKMPTFPFRGARYSPPAVVSCTHSPYATNCVAY